MKTPAVKEYIQGEAVGMEPSSTPITTPSKLNTHSISIIFSAWARPMPISNSRAKSPASNTQLITNDKIGMTTLRI